MTTINPIDEVNAMRPIITMETVITYECTECVQSSGYILVRAPRAFPRYEKCDQCELGMVRKVVSVSSIDPSDVRVVQVTGERPADLAANMAARTATAATTATE